MVSPRTTSCPLDILVIGAGVGGLSAALSCALAGHRVLICEAARELAEIGAGFQITPNGARLFSYWGIEDVLRPKAAFPAYLAVRRYSDGKVLSRTDDFHKDMTEKYGTTFWDLHRVDLQLAMVERAKQLGIQIRLDAKVSDIDFDRPAVTLANGDVLNADLIVGADGLWSKCRERFLAVRGKADSPLPTGDLAYRIVLNAEDVGDTDLRDFIANPSVNFWIGPGCHVVSYSIRGGKTINIVLLQPDNLPPDVARQPGSVEEMHELFKDWDPMLTRFLAQVKAVDKWKLMHRPELDSWISDQSTFVFLGDACHPMLPYLAQGANSSLEDGAVLGGVLAALSSKDQLPEALKLYESLRKKRGEAIARETFHQRKDFHMDDGPEQEARDNLMLEMLEKGRIDKKFPSRWQCPEVQPWLYGYDAIKETEAALSTSSLVQLANGVHES